MSITTRFPKIPKEQITPLVAELLELIQLQMDEIQFLRDEIARLKAQKPRPNIKPSRLENSSTGVSGLNAKNRYKALFIQRFMQLSAVRPHCRQSDDLKRLGLQIGSSLASLVAGSVL